MARIFMCRVLINSQPILKKLFFYKFFLGVLIRKVELHTVAIYLYNFFCNTNLNDCSPMILITFESLYEIVFH